MKRRGLVTAGAAGALMFLVAVGAFRLGRARADGPPTTDALFYAGTIEENGVPVTGTTRTVNITLWDSLTGTDMSGIKCTSKGDNIPITAGRFRLALDPMCVTAMTTNPNLYVEAKVGDTVLPRRKLGAVPYSIEAGRASAAGGALRTELDTVKSNITTIQNSPQYGTHSAFLAYKTDVQNLQDGLSDVIVFQMTDYDDSNEFDIPTSTFIPKQDGTYLVTCSIMFNTLGLTEMGSPGKTTALHVVAIIKNGRTTDDFQVASNSFFGDDYQATVMASKVAQLKANDKIVCVGYQTYTGSYRPIDASKVYFQQPRNYFSAVRLF